LSQTFLILSAKHSPEGELAQWWGPNRASYTTVVAEAGRYTLAEALDICHTGHPTMPPSSFVVPLGMIDGTTDGFRAVGEAVRWSLAKTAFIPIGQPMQREVPLADWEERRVGDRILK
jgi:hypothetical protein